MKGRCAVRRIWKLVLMIVIVCFEAVAVSGCDFYSRQHPDTDPQVQWVSEVPNMSFAWDEENGGHRGELVIEGNTSLIGVGFRSEHMDVRCEDPESYGSTLFGGKCKFGKNQITLSVMHDNADIFGGDLPTIVFKKKNKDEGEESQADGSSALTEFQKGNNVPANSDGNK